MALWRSKKLILAAFVPILGIWLYALGQSAGEVSSLMQLVPERTPAPVSETTALASDAAPVREFVESKGSPVGSNEPEAESRPDPGPEPEIDVESPDRMPAANEGAVGAVAEGDYLAEEFPYQRSFDPFVYEQVRQEHFDSRPEYRIPPGGRDEERSELQELEQHRINPQLEAAVAD